MIFLDGVFVDDEKEGQRFVNVQAPKESEMMALVHKISLRVARYLERAGIIRRDEENTFFADDALENDGMVEHRAHSINYLISMGPQKGRKVFTLKCEPPRSDEMQGEILGKVAGFSLHAGVAVKLSQRDKLERLCRYISRPAVSEHRLSLTPQSNIRYELKTPYRNGTTHVIFDPLDFISKLAALVPIPRVNLTRFHGILAPNSQYRKDIIPRQKKVETKTAEDYIKTESEKRAAMTWAQRLKRAFNIDINKCEA